MPATDLSSPLKPEIYNKIIQGQLTSTEKNLTTFKKFLGILSALPACANESTHSDNSRPVLSDPSQTLPCLKSDEIKVSFMRQKAFFQDLFKNHQLKNSFNYLASFIDQNIPTANIDQNDIEKLLHICNIFFSIDHTNLDLTSKKINEMNQAFFKLFLSISKLPEILLISSDVGSLEIFKLMGLSFGYFRKFIKLNKNITDEAKQYQIYSLVKSYLEGVGNIILIFRNKHSEADLSLFEDNVVQLFKSLTHLTADQLSTLRYTFLHQYHSDTDLLGECKKLFNTTNCDPYEVNYQYNLIYNGRSVRNKYLTPMVKKLLFGSNEEKQSRLSNLSKTVDKNNPLDNFLDYFKTSIKEANQKNAAIESATIEDLSKLIFYLTKTLKSTQPKSKIYDSVFSLLLNLLKNSAVNDQFTHVWYAIQACSDQMENLLSAPQIGINSSLSILADIFHLANDIHAISVNEKQIIANKIGELTTNCIKTDFCESSSALEQFFITLGSMVRSLSKKNQTLSEKKATQAIEETAKQIIQHAKNESNISEPRFQGLVWCYLKGRHDKNIRAIQTDCKEVFGLTNCQEIIIANQTARQGIDTTILSFETTTNRTMTNSVTTIPTIIPLSLHESVTPVITTTETSITSTELPVNAYNTSSNQTVANRVNEKNTGVSLINPEVSLGASAMHGAGSGMINGITQYFATRYSQGEPSSKAKAVAIYTSLLAHAAFSATFSLILFKLHEHINQGNEDEAQQLWDNLLYQALPTFFSSAGLSLSLQALIEFSHCLTARFHIQAITRSTIPVLGTAYNLAANPLETAVQLSTSIATSSLTYFGLNRFFSAKNQHQLDIEAIKNKKLKYHIVEDTVEMQALNEEKQPHDNNTIIQKDSIPAEIFFKKVQFTTSKQFNDLKQYLSDVIKQVENLQKSLSDQEHCNRLGKVIDIPQSTQGLCYDLEDLKAFPKKFETEYNQCKNDAEESAVLKNNFNYFKTMIKTIYDKLLSDNVHNDCLKDILCSIESNTLKENITMLIKSIKQNLGFIRTITKPIISIHLSKEPTEPVHKNETAQLVRQYSKGINHINNRYTYHANSDSDTRVSSGSERGSILSASSSKDEEEVQIDRSLLKTK